MRSTDTLVAIDQPDLKRDFVTGSADDVQAFDSPITAASAHGGGVQDAVINIGLRSAGAVLVASMVLIL